MKNVLVIAYYFPPSGGAGVQRTLKHVQYLRDFGWNPIVLTVSNGDFPARDESLLSKIPSGIQVERTTIIEPYNLYRKLTGKPAGAPVDVDNVKKDNAERSLAQRLAEFIRATVFIPDARVGWLLSAIPRGMELISKHNIEAIYSSAPPYTTALIGRALKRKTGLRWVLGLRDPWTGFISGPRRWWLPAAIEQALERSCYAEADAIECAWEGIVSDVAAKMPLQHGNTNNKNNEKTHHIPNGFDSSDYPFAPLDASLNGSSNEAASQPPRFTITYTGAMYGRRNPQEFFAALLMLHERSTVPASSVLVRFAGRFGGEIHAMFEDFSARYGAHSLDVLGYMPHEDSIRQLLRSDALLLVVDEAKESEEIVPGKVYEYMGAGKPIIAVAPRPSAIERLLDETSAGQVAHQSDVERLAGIIQNYYDDWQRRQHGEPMRFAPRADRVNAYERRNATKRLADLLSGA
jgi:glycosyltransferase involved in cell wall biosynthesis